MRKASILIVEDSNTLAQTYSQYLKSEPYNISFVETGKEALESLKEHLPQAIILDLNLPDMDGMRILKKIQKDELPVAVVIVTANDSVNTAVEAMQIGAKDFIVKPFSAQRLKTTLKNAIEHQDLTQIATTFKENFAKESFFGFIGSSLSMQQVYRIVDSAAPSKATVFISGQSGTGKEVCAEAIHQSSPRVGGPFIAVNCAGIPKDLMESEMFGHVKGAFTGAIAERYGAASRAHNGTLFLDEICEMDLDLQSKLLRFVQTGTFQKVGGSKQEKVDVRIICATNRNVLAEVESGRFREDLFYRLHVIPLELPPLKDREGDVLEIANKFLTQYAKEEGKKFKTFDEEVEAIFCKATWAGNVRELQNVVRNIVVLNDGKEVTRDMLSPPLNTIKVPKSKIKAKKSTKKETFSDLKPLWKVERELIEKAIDHCEGNIPQAAKILEISAPTIYRKQQGWKGKRK